MPDHGPALTRRRMLGLAGATLGTAIAPRIAAAAQAVGEPMNLLPPGYIDIVDEPGLVPIRGEEQLPKHLQRTPVFFRTTYPVGSVVVDTSERYLYLSTGPQKALRYGVGVGKEGFQWDGLLKVSRKAEWPSWRPPEDMLKRNPKLPKFMEGGPGNPLGARALYLGDTVYRIHGTNQPSTIGKFVSSGCVGMLNEDVTDLYERAKVGTRVVVLPGNPTTSPAVASAAPNQTGYTPSPAYGERGMAPVAPPRAASSRMDATTAPPLPAPVTVR